MMRTVLFGAVAVAATHYGKPPCRDDETEGELPAGGGIMCLTVCSPPDGECPTDVPEGVTAKPVCSDMGWCSLLCDADSQCGKGGQCNLMYRQCTYPTSGVEGSSLVQSTFVAETPEVAEAGFAVAATKEEVGAECPDNKVCPSPDNADCCCNRVCPDTFIPDGGHRTTCCPVGEYCIVYYPPYNKCSKIAFVV